MKSKFQSSVAITPIAPVVTLAIKRKGYRGINKQLNTVEVEKLAMEAPVDDVVNKELEDDDDKCITRLLGSL